MAPAYLLAARSMVSADDDLVVTVCDLPSGVRTHHCSAPGTCFLWLTVLVPFFFFVMQVCLGSSYG